MRVSNMKEMIQNILSRLKGIGGKEAGEIVDDIKKGDYKDAGNRVVDQMGSGSRNDEGEHKDKEKGKGKGDDN